MPVGLGVGALLALAILWKVPEWQVGRVRRLDAKERFDRVNEARKTLAQILGGIVLLAGFFGTWQNIKVAQKSVTVSQESAQEALEVSRKGQITDRFTKAIEQLGAVDDKGKKKLEVRLGGIYALEGIANESKELHWPIVEVLCAYVRVNAPAPSKGDKPVSEARKPRNPPKKNQTATPPPRPAADIQAILTVLGRRDTKYEEETQHLDLGDIDIRGANLTRANFTGANLSGADLGEADLSVADLGEANLSGAFLIGANLSWAFLTEADLSGADLREANLREAHLREADLSGAHLFGADLRDAVDLTQKQINAAKGDSATKLPYDLHMPESWKK